MEIGIPLTPRSPRPKILDPERFSPCIRSRSRRDKATGASVTIGHDSDPGLFGVRPVLEDLSDVTLVLDADVLGNGISLITTGPQKLCDPPNPQDACRCARS